MPGTDGSEAVVWTRDELGEYHDGHDNLIARGHDGWWLFPGSAVAVGPFKTLQAAKREADQRRGGH